MSTQNGISIQTDFKEATVKVFYPKKHLPYETDIGYLLRGKEPSAQAFISDFVEVYQEKVQFATKLTQDLEGLKHLAETYFTRFNDDHQNPLSVLNGGQWRVKNTGAAHTSMSVGDIVVFTIGEKTTALQAKNEGFEAVFIFGRN